MNTLTFSIVTPSYNQGQFIEETIKSVLSQKGDFYIDYIVMDGGSTDNSVEIIKEYERLLKEDKWPIKCKGIEYRWASEKDRGQADAVNKGWSMAKGEILGWLNSDDILLPQAVKEAIGVFTQTSETAVVYGQSYYINEEGGVINRFNTERFHRDLFQEICYIPQPSVFLHRRVLDRIGMLDEALHYCMDYDLWIRAGKEFDFAYIDKYLSAARIYSKTKTMSRWIDAAGEEMKLIKRHYGIVSPPVIYRYIKAEILSKSKFPLSFAVPLILLLTFLKYIEVNGRLPLYPLKMWINWAKNMHMSNKQGLDIHLRD